MTHPLNRVQNRPQLGLTLFEILLSMALFLVIAATLIGMLSVNVSGTKETASTSQLQLDSQAATLLLGNRIREAVYVYPTGSALDLPAQNHMRNYLQSSTGSTRWTVGTLAGQDRGFLAFLLPPQDPTVACGTATPAGCYTFYAYYPIPRSKLLEATSISNLQKPSTSQPNNNQWVLMEYRATVPAVGIAADTYFNVTSPPSSANIANGEARMLLDLVSPTGFQFTQDRARDSVTLTYSLADLGKPGGKFPVSGTQTVTFNARNWQ